MQIDGERTSAASRPIAKRNGAGDCATAVSNASVVELTAPAVRSHSATVGKTLIAVRTETREAAKP